MKYSQIKLFCIFFILALIVRIFFFIQINQHPISKLDFVFKSSDMYDNLQWSKEIIKGDILGKNTYHPFHKWMSEIATLSKWHEWWGGKEIFQQVPLYPYFLAFLIKIFGNNFDIIRICQHILGALTIALITTISSLLFGKRAGIFSGIVSSMYFPFLCYEFYFLRDFLSVHFLCWLILIMILNYETPKYFYFILTGILSGILILTRENFLILIICIWFLLPKYKEEKNFLSLSKAYVLLGMLFILSFLFIRNSITGAPIFSFSNRLLESLIEGNSFDSNPIFMTMNDSFKKYFYDGEGNAFKTFILIFNDHNGFINFLIFQLKKILFLFYYLEPYNNLNLYYYKTEFPSFIFLPDYSSVILFSISGLFLHIKKKYPKNIIYLFVFLAISILAGPVLARYRLILIPFYLIWIGLFFEEVLFIFKKTSILKITFYTLGFIIITGICLNKTLPDELTKRELEYVFTEKVKLQH